MSAGKRIMKEQEMLEDAPIGNGKYRLPSSTSKLTRGVSNSDNEPQLLEKQSTFSKFSNVFSFNTNTADPQQSQSQISPTSKSRGYHRSTTSRAAPLKIEELFATHFSRNLEELYQIAEPRRSSNEAVTIDSLRNILKTVLDEIETLKEKCMAVETRYKEATLTASRELQESMNILFKLQQKTATLEDSSKAVEKLTYDLKYFFFISSV